jgi:transcriptional regulator with XRE-family HTH domain
MFRAPIRVCSKPQKKSYTYVGIACNRTTTARNQSKLRTTNGHAMPYRKLKERRATPEDKEIAKRVRTRRLELTISQTELGKRCGVTFQQIQKYESGANRIGAGRLVAIAEALEVPASYFFATAPSVVNSKGESTESLFDYLQNPNTVRIVKGLKKIQSRNLRALLVQLVEELASPISV